MVGFDGGWVLRPYAMPCHAMSSDGRRHAPPPGQRPRYMMEIGMMWNPSTNDSTSESPHAKKKSEMPDGDGG